MLKHYNKKYFEWQSQIGKFGGRANLSKFSKYIKSTDNVIDYGCGGGYLLSNIHCKEKIGIEINHSARAIARKNNIAVVSKIDSVKNSWANIIISNHVLEHTENPLQEIKSLYPKLKKGGKIIFYVPCDTHQYKYDSKDSNKHLYSWSPMNLGNLFSAAGYKVVQVEPYLSKWPKNYQIVEKIFGAKMFQFFSWIKGHMINDHWSQVRIIATK